MNKRLFRRSVFGSVAVGALVISGAAQAQDADAESEDVLEIIDEAPQDAVSYTHLTLPTNREV